MMMPEPAFAIPHPVFDPGCLDLPHDLFSFLDQLPSGPNPARSNSSSEDANPAQTPSPSAADERKRRRMISNRESARRSRMRKQRHLEDLRNTVNRLRSQNREMSNQLGFVSHHCDLVRRDNDRLRADAAGLRQRLSDIRRILFYRQLQHLVSSNEQIPQLIA